MTESVKKRFLDKVDVREIGCWEWQASLNENGYGFFRYQGRIRLAHRVAYLLFVGDIPNGLGVLHHCDNSKCVRPEHLFVGDQADNMQDASNKGRCRGDDMMGSLNQNAKLTPEKVVGIRRRAAAGASRRTIAREFGVSATTVQKILDGRCWSHVQ